MLVAIRGIEVVDGQPPQILEHIGDTHDQVVFAGQFQGFAAGASGRVLATFVALGDVIGDFSVAQAMQFGDLWFEVASAAPADFFQRHVAKLVFFKEESELDCAVNEGEAVGRHPQGRLLTDGAALGDRDFARDVDATGMLDFQ